MTLKRQFQHLLKIANKERDTVPFNLNQHQLKYFAGTTRRDIILKSRQMGFSAGILGKLFLKCNSVQNTQAVVISHDSKSTKSLFQRVHFYAKHFAVPVELGRSSTNEITFPETDSSFYIGTAGAREFGRGDTITDLHCSEFAFWPDADQIVRGLFQAVPRDGYIAIESTANGFGNSFHRRCTRALKQLGDWSLHFYPWYISTEYSWDPDEDFKLFGEEKEYKNIVFDATGFTLSDGQILWRRNKMEEFGEDRQLGITPEQFFDQEYPYSFDSAFLVSGSGIFTSLGLSPTTKPAEVRKDGKWTYYEEPDPDGEYVIGADPAEGLMLDETVAEVVKLGNDDEPPRQVAEYCSDTIAPDLFSGVLADAGNMYNKALIVVERNNHGLTTLSFLKLEYDIFLLYRQRRIGTGDYTDPEQELLGLRTTTNKPTFVDDLYGSLRGGLVYYSELLDSELKSFVEIRSQMGKPMLQAQSGCMDNRVMAMVMAIQGMKVYYRMTFREPKPPPIPFNSVAGIMARRTKHKRKVLRGSLTRDYLERVNGIR